MHNLLALRDFTYLEVHPDRHHSASELVLAIPELAKRFSIGSAAFLHVLMTLTRPVPASTLQRTMVDQLRIDDHEASMLLAELIKANVLESVCDTQRDHPFKIWHRYNWEVSALYHFMSRRTAFRDIDGRNETPMEARQEVIEGYRGDGAFPYRDITTGEADSNIIDLPDAPPDVEWDLHTVLTQRRTRRTWQWRSLSKKDMGTLLWYGLRPIGENRAVINADPDFLHADSLKTHFAHLGIWVLPLRVDDVQPNVIYRYDGANHRLIAKGRFDSGESLEPLCVGQVPLRDASLVVIVSGMFDEFMWRYRHNRAYSILWLEVGQMMQSLLLSATGMNLRPFITPALRDSAVDALLGLDGYREGAMYFSAFG